MEYFDDSIEREVRLDKLFDDGAFSWARTGGGKLASNKIKKIIFRDTPENHSELKKCLVVDDLKQSEFFRLIVQKYLVGDERIVDIIEEYKIQNDMLSKRSKQIKKKQRDEGSELEKKFNISSEEIQEIYDKYDD